MKAAPLPGKWPQVALLAASVLLAAGAAGCVLAGLLADRLGRTRITAWSLALSGKDVFFV